MQKRRTSAAVARYWVYVIELEPIACKGSTCMYVGSSARDPASRLAQHRKRKMFSGRVAHYGVRLRYDLMPRHSFATRKEAEAVEYQLSSTLRKRGYKVVQG